ncbi:hypothetical protein lbkm_3668 [Lachnospiraceae bacterium KM106-2]|nr:hypothetical protein lbkm_3668 [Lachnospiraceae bacterium KM106-2]
MNLIKADFYSIFHRKSFYIMFGLMVVCAFAFVATSYGVESGALGKSAIGTASGFMDTMILNIVGPILAAIFICSDFQNKTIHDMVLQNGRRKIVWAKMVPYAGVIAIMLLPYALFTLIGCLSGGKFSVMFANSVDSSYMTMLANETKIAFDGKTVVKLFLVLVVIALIYISRMSICLLLSVLIKRPVAVVGIGIIVELLLSLVAVAGADSKAVTSAIDWTPFLMLRKNNLTASVADLLKTAGTSLVFITIILNITTGIFIKAEVK